MTCNLHEDHDFVASPQPFEDFRSLENYEKCIVSPITTLLEDKEQFDELKVALKTSSKTHMSAKYNLHLLLTDRLKETPAREKKTKNAPGMRGVDRSYSDGARRGVPRSRAVTRSFSFVPLESHFNESCSGLFNMSLSDISAPRRGVTRSYSSGPRVSRGIPRSNSSTPSRGVARSVSFTPGEGHFVESRTHRSLCNSTGMSRGVPRSRGVARSCASASMQSHSIESLASLSDMSSSISSTPSREIPTRSYSSAPSESHVNARRDSLLNTSSSVSSVPSRGVLRSYSSASSGENHFNARRNGVFNVSISTALRRGVPRSYSSASSGEIQINTCLDGLLSMSESYPSEPIRAAPKRTSSTPGRGVGRSISFEPGEGHFVA